MYVQHHALYSRSKATAESKVSVLLRAFKGKPLAGIGQMEIMDFVAERKSKGASGATCNRDLAALSKIFRLADIPNPCRKVQRFKESAGRTRYLTADEATRLIDKASEHLKPLLIVALNTGGRRGELLALTWKDIDLDAAILWFRVTKSGKERMLPLNDAALAALRTLGPQAPWVRVFQFQGHPLQSVRSSFTRARKAAGLGRDVTFHTLRHTFASWAAMNGLDLYRLQKYLGHSTPKMTERYSHLSPEYLKRGAAFFGFRGDGK